jgi:hypothetical protein
VHGLVKSQQVPAQLLLTEHGLRVHLQEPQHSHCAQPACTNHISDANTSTCAGMTAQ